MPLDFQKISVPLAGGVSEKQDPLQVPAVKLLNLINGQFDTPGASTRRLGFLKSAFPINTSPDAIAQLGTETLEHANNALYSYTMNSWLSKGAATIAIPSVEPLISNSNAQSTPDWAVGGTGYTGYTCHVWEESGAGVLYEVRDAATHAVIGSGVVHVNGASPKVMGFGTGFVISYCRTNSIRKLYAKVVACATPNSIGAEIDIDNGTTCTRDQYDCFISSSYIYYFWIGVETNPTPFFRAMGTSYTMASSPAAVTGAWTSGNVLGPISAWMDVNYFVYVAVWDSTTGYAYVQKAARIPITWTNDPSPWGPVRDVHDVIISVRNIAGLSYSGTDYAVLISQTSAERAQDVVLYRKSTSGTPGTVKTSMSMCMVSKPWLVVDKLYFLGLHDSTLQATYFLVSFGTAKELVAKVLPGTGGASPGRSVLPEASSYTMPVTVKNHLISTGGVLSSTTGISMLKFDFTQYPDIISYAQALMISGGYLRSYDGVNLTETGFHLFPEDLTSDNTYEQEDVAVPANFSAAATAIYSNTLTGTRYYSVTAINSCGETLPATAMAVSTANRCVTLSWIPSDGASGYRVYRGASAGALYLLDYVDGGSSASYLDTGLLTLSSTAAPVSDTTATAYSLPLAPTAVTVDESIACALAGHVTLQYLPAPTMQDRGLIDWSEHTTYLHQLSSNFKYMVRAVNGSYNGFFSDVASVAITDFSHAIHFTWTAVSGATSYEVWREYDEFDSGKFGYITSVTGTAFTDTGYAPGPPTYTTVWNQRSDWTNGTLDGNLAPGAYTYAASCITVYGENIPLDETTVTVGGSGGGGVEADWASQEGVTGYKLFRKDGATAAFKLIACFYTTGASPYVFDIGYTAGSTPNTDPVTSNTFGGTIPATARHYYQVTAGTATGESLPSTEESFVLSAVGGIRIRWNVVAGALWYRVYRAEAPGAEKLLVGQTAALGGPIGGTKLSWTDQSVGSYVNDDVPPSKDSSFKTDKAYEYVSTYEWLDARGFSVKSAPSNALQVYLLEEVGAAKTLVITIPVLNITDKTNVRVVLYRTIKNGSVLYRVGDAANVVTGTTVSISDSTADTTLEGNSQLYTTGGVLENVVPGALISPIIHNGRVFGIDPTNRLRVYYSKERMEGVPAEFSDFLTFTLDEVGGDLVGLASLDGNLIFLKKERILHSSSRGPDQRGEGDNYSDILPLPGNCGCLDPRSIASSAEGVYFRSERGIYRLDRSMSLTYVGADIEPELASKTVNTVCVVPTRHQVRFGLAASNTLLIWDWLVSQWSKWTLPAAVTPLASGMLSGSYSVVGSDGYLSVETDNTWIDVTAPIVRTVKTAWIKLDGLQGWQRTRRIGIVGTKGVGNTVLTFNVYNDYSTTVAQTVSITTAGGAGPVDYQIRLDHQKAKAVQLELIDTPAAAPRDSGLVLSAITFEVGLKRGLAKTPASQRY